MGEVRMAQRKVHRFGGKLKKSCYLLIPQDLMKTMGITEGAYATYYIETDMPTNRLIVEFGKKISKI